MVPRLLNTHAVSEQAMPTCDATNMHCQHAVPTTDFSLRLSMQLQSNQGSLVASICQFHYTQLAAGTYSSGSSTDHDKQSRTPLQRVDA